MLLLIRSLPLSFALNFVPRMLEMAFQKLFLGENAPGPLRLRVPTAPCSCSRLFFSNQLPTSNFIETPAFSPYLAANFAFLVTLLQVLPPSRYLAASFALSPKLAVGFASYHFTPYLSASLASLPYLAIRVAHTCPIF